jgi:hypothetical protein
MVLPIIITMQRRPKPQSSRPPLIQRPRQLAPLRPAAIIPRP